VAEIDHMIDKHDRKILEALQQDSGLARLALAEKVGLSDSQVARRRQALEERGLIRRYRAELDAPRLGFAVTAFVHVKLHNHSKGNSKRFADMVAHAPGIMEAHAVTGDFDYLLKLAVRDLNGLQRVINDTLLAHAAVDRVKSEIVLETLRDDAMLDFSGP
jgi:DNA-binding Lrp family transcriptional regulator